MTFLFVCFQYLYADIVRQILAGADSDAAASHDKDFLYFRVFLAGMHLHVFDMFFGRRKENDIAGQDKVGTAGDNRFILPFDGNDMVQLLFVQQFGQLFVHQAGVFANLHPDQDQGSSEQFPVLACPRAAYRVDDLFGCQHFRIDHRVDAQLFEQFFVFRQQIFVVVDTCQSFACSQLGGQDTCRNIRCLFRSNADEQVCFLYAGFFQVADRSRITNHRKYLHIGVGDVQPFLTRVHQDDILFFLR